MRQARERSLTLRSRRPSTAWHLGREPVVHIIGLAAQAPTRGGRLSSNVRQRRNTVCRTAHSSSPPPLSSAHARRAARLPIHLAPSTRRSRRRSPKTGSRASLADERASHQHTQGLRVGAGRYLSLGPVQSSHARRCPESVHSSKVAAAGAWTKTRTTRCRRRLNQELRALVTLGQTRSKHPGPHVPRHAA